MTQPQNATPSELAALLAYLVGSWPGSRFTDTNAAAYTSELSAFPAKEIHEALKALVLRGEEKHIPSLPTIIGEIRYQRREAARIATSRPALPPIIDGGRSRSVGPSPAAWGATLREMLAAASRHRAMSDKWYRNRGKTPPPDPGQAHVDLATRGARGEDILERDVRRVL